MKISNWYNKPEGSKYFDKLNFKNLFNHYHVSAILKGISDCIENDKWLTKIEKEVPKLSEECSLPNYVGLTSLTEDNKKNVQRIIKDGRIPDKDIVDGILKLLPVYAKYTDKTITDGMIERFNKPLTQAFEL